MRAPIRTFQSILSQGGAACTGGACMPRCHVVNRVKGRELGTKTWSRICEHKDSQGSQIHKRTVQTHFTWIVKPFLCVNELRSFFSSPRTPWQHLEERDSSGNTPLLLAALHGDVDGLAKLLDAGADTSVRNKEDWTVLHCAAYGGNLPEDMCRTLCERLRYDLNAKDRFGWTALHLAASNGQDVAARVLCEVGGKQLLSEKNWTSQTPLDIAVQWKSKGVIRILEDTARRNDA